jgi:hypothetical protein
MSSWLEFRAHYKTRHRLVLTRSGLECCHGWSWSFTAITEWAADTGEAT